MTQFKVNLASLDEIFYLCTYKLVRINMKLTLSIDQEIIEAAKDYARKHKRSLSNIVEEYLKALSDRKSTKGKGELSKIVRELKGSIKLPRDSKSYKDLLQDALVEKYLK